MLRRRKRKQAPIEEDDREWSTFVDLIDETMSSIQLLMNRNKSGFAAYALPPIVLWHQLYTILPNRTFIDQNVHRLRSKGKLITFKLSSGTKDVAILRAEDYRAEVKKYENVFREQLRQHPGDSAISLKLNAVAAYGRALPQISSLPTAPINLLVSVMRDDGSNVSKSEARAMVGYVFKRDDALEWSLFATDLWLMCRQIQRLGFLLPTTRLDDEAYHFSIPGIGKFVSAIKKTRTLILGTLKRTKYKEMHEQQLKLLKLKHSHFRCEFHLADMEGCGLIRRTEVTSGLLIALADNS